MPQVCVMGIGLTSAYVWCALFEPAAPAPAQARSLGYYSNGLHVADYGSLLAQAILSFVCDGARRLGQKKTCNRTYLSFYAVTLCEVVASAKIDESLVERLLPHVVDGLDAAAASDYRAATLMVIAEMASRAVLSAAFLSGEQVQGGVCQHVSGQEGRMGHAAGGSNHLRGCR